jgi:uncharacterized membrane protein YbaN (DUF454 family)
MQPSKGELGRPYDSTSGIPKDVQYVAICLIIVFVLYVLIRVRKVWHKGGADKK